MTDKVKIIGAGLAGPEAAWQCARRDVPVELFEMRPARQTPAHESGDFAELVCSNSLKSDSENTAPWLLKQEMRRAGSLLMEVARQTSVPAGHALAVDRLAFARAVTEAIEREPLITVHREEVTAIAEDSAITIIASGPLTSDGLAREIERLAASGDPAAGDGAARLYFYDSISPIVEADSIDAEKVYRAARYDKGTADYINCPMSEEEYNRFLDGLIAAQTVDAPAWETTPTDATVTSAAEPKLNYFEGCLPIEEIARRGRDTLRFGPMKPVGLRDPRSGRLPYAVVQLRQENLRADSYNLVGFQNHLRFGEQARVLRLIPGLENARFLRYGQIHRNTYINAPALLPPHFTDEAAPARDLRGTDFRSRGVRRIDCHRTARRHRRRRPGRGQAAGGGAALIRPGLAGALHLSVRSPQLSAGQHYLRSAGAARRSHPSPGSRQKNAPSDGVRARPCRIASVADGRPAACGSPRRSAAELSAGATGADSAPPHPPLAVCCLQHEFKWYSMAYGLLVVSIGLWLESRRLVLSSQLFILTAMALSAPIVLAARSGELRRRWFGVALAACAVIHAGFIAILSRFLPFSNLNPAIGVGFAEMVILALLSAKIRSRYKT